MSDPFFAEIRIFGFTFPPLGWAICDGQLLSVSQNQALYSIISNIYGGDGRNTFALPNIQGRMPLHKGQGPGLTPFSLGEFGGSSSVVLQESQLPAHEHIVTTGYDKSDTNTPAYNTYMGQSVGTPAYNTASTPTVQMSDSALSPTGQNHPHQNMQPYLPMLFCICVDGYYPSKP